jgi:hypothetical protein
MSPAEELLQVWRPIFQEGIALCDGINQVPNSCACRDADQHLNGQCDCPKDEIPPASGEQGNETCSEILSRLRADLSLFSQDFARIAAPLANGAERGLELRRDVFLTIDDLQRIVEAVGRLDKAVVGFRRTCDLLELRRLKQRSNELRDHLTELNKLLDVPQLEAGNQPR